MQSLEEDIKYVTEVLNNICYDEFPKIYSNTNENLLALFNNINIKDKDIFTVLSSSDYLYMAYLNRTRYVDTFDINPLTYRYYYLRKWLLQNKIIDINMVDFNKIKEILSKVNYTSLDEKESLIFWKYVLNILKDSDLLFMPCFNCFNEYYKDKIDLILKYLTLNRLTFYNLDICQKFSLLNKNYDYIFLSNILDYNRDKEKLEIVINNFLPIIKTNGSIVCSHIGFYSNENIENAIRIEKEMFEEYFTYERIYLSDSNEYSYYRYIKR